LCLLPDILLVGLLSETVSLIDLSLNSTLIVLELFKFLGEVFALAVVRNLLVLQHDHVNLGILLLHNETNQVTQQNSSLVKLTSSS